MTTTTPQRPAGWYPDTTGRHQYRYWDGNEWTDDVSDVGITAHDAPAMTAPTAPLVAPPVPVRHRSSGPRVTAVVVALVVVVALIAGGIAALVRAGSDEESELDRLRDRAADEFITDDQAEAVLADALALAAANPGTPEGDDAFAFAETRFLEWLDAAMFDNVVFADAVPLPPSQDSYSYLEIRSLLGFAQSVPAPYVPTEVGARFTAEYAQEADTALAELESLLATRRQWVAQLQGGSTTLSWGALSDPDGLGYLRDVAVQAGEPPEFLAAWDAVVAAAFVSGFAPRSSDSSFENDTFVSTYTDAAIAEASRNNDDLEAAIASARVYYPPLGTG